MSGATRIPYHTTAVVTRLAVGFALPEPPAGSQCQARPRASVPINRLHTNNQTRCGVRHVTLPPLPLTLLPVLCV